MSSNNPQDPAEAPRTVPSSSWPWPALVAHRGGGILAPENTLAAFRVGQANGYRMMEYDVKLSRDNVPIVLHDDTVDRTSDGSGAAAAMTLADLLRHDYGSWHSAMYAGEALPTLYSIAAFTRANNLHSNIEIKPCRGREAITGSIVAATARTLWSGASLAPLLSSFSEEALAAARHAAPELPRALLIENELPGDWQARVKHLDCQGLNLNHKHLTRDLVREITTLGYSLAAWTVNDVARARLLFDWGCHAVVTDEIGKITQETVLNGQQRKPAIESP